MDLQLYTENPKDSSIINVQYFRNGKNKNIYKKEWFFPLKTIEFENIIFPCVQQ